MNLRTLRLVAGLTVVTSVALSSLISASQADPPRPRPAGETMQSPCTSGSTMSGGTMSSPTAMSGGAMSSPTATSGGAMSSPTAMSGGAMQNSCEHGGAMSGNTGGAMSR
jgi:hypothetical protein